MNKKIAILSVSDKTGIIELAKTLIAKQWQIVATTNTANFLKEANLSTTPVDDFTGFPEVLDGRVKTLHPKIFAGILCDTHNSQHIHQLKELKISPIALVAVNLYRPEKIDIGGVSLLRAAAKNYQNVIVLSDPADYPTIINYLQKNKNIPLTVRKKLAAKVFFHTSYYDATIARKFLTKSELFPEKLTLPLRKISSLRYGENPHQKAAVYQSEYSLSNCFQQISGKELSYNNYLDISAASQLVQEFTEPACAIIKHTNPCGVALGKNSVTSYRRALAADTQSAFGGIVAFNRDVDEKTAQEITKIFTECVVAPGYTLKAKNILTQKKNLRLIIFRNKKNDSLEWRSSNGYILLQESDKKIWEEAKTVTEKTPTAKELKNLKFAFTVAKYVKSNAIVLAQDYQTIGIGAGQMSRIDSLKIAIQKMQQLKIKKNSSLVLASDGFFPFSDVVELAAKVGVKAIVQPGGSIRDKESIEAANRHNIAMLFTGIRHFRH